ncbi:hypothetical protein ACFYVR_16130 [Rhodococcus sp. NPDC003318]|uniref:hypothetical protein n=1 Tax=Rhodococcus sp. NPDC003318 TaxID=3364503 RepID=UPI0036D06600
MTDDELDALAAVHFDGDPDALAAARRDPEAAKVLDALDLVTLELQVLSVQHRAAGAAVLSRGMGQRHERS